MGSLSVFLIIFVHPFFCFLLLFLGFFFLFVPCFFFLVFLSGRKSATQEPRRQVFRNFFATEPRSPILSDVRPVPSRRKLRLHPKISKITAPKSEKKKLTYSRRVGATRADPSSRRLSLEFPPSTGPGAKTTRRYRRKTFRPKFWVHTDIVRKIRGGHGIFHTHFGGRTAARPRILNDKFGRGKEPFTHNSAGTPPRTLQTKTRRRDRIFNGPCRWSCLGLCLTLA